MTETLENKTKSYKMKPREMIVPVVGTRAYYNRCWKNVIPLENIDYANKVSLRFAGLMARDIFLASGAIVYTVISMSQ